MGEALAAILGENAKGLSPTNIVRLKEQWTKEYDNWCKRSLEGKEYVYIWADGIYCNVRLSDERPCLLVLIGATSEGQKELLAVYDGIRESKLSWKTVLSDLKKRGLSKAPQLGIGDGALGFWAALEEEFPSLLNQQIHWIAELAQIPTLREIEELEYLANYSFALCTVLDEILGSPLQNETMPIYERLKLQAIRSVNDDCHDMIVKERLEALSTMPLNPYYHDAMVSDLLAIYLAEPDVTVTEMRARFEDNHLPKP